MPTCNLYFFCEEMSVQVLCPFFIRLLVFLVLRHMGSLYILFVNPLSDESPTNIFFHTVGCLFVLMMMPLLYGSFFVWSGPSCSFFILFPLPRGMCPGKNCSYLCSTDTCLCFLLRVLWFHVFRSLIHFKYTFVYGVRQ